MLILSPQEDEDGFLVRNSIQLGIVVQERLDTVNQTRTHLVHLIKDEQRAFTVADVALDPLPQLRLRRNSSLLKP